MYAQILKNAFDRYFDVPINIWIEFANRCDVVNFDKEEVMKQDGASEKYFYFILSGSAGVFLWRKNNFVCLDLALQNNFFCDYMSLLTGRSSPIQTMTIEKSAMLRMTGSNYYKLSQEPAAQKILRIAAEASFIDKQQQQIDLLTKTAQERYHTLLEKNREIFQRIPQKYIASYLGITPQSLSRLRKSTS